MVAAPDSQTKLEAVLAHLPDMDPADYAPRHICNQLDAACQHQRISRDMATAGINTARTLAQSTGLLPEALVADDGGLSIELEHDGRELSVVIAQAGNKWGVYFSTRLPEGLFSAGKIKNPRGLEDLARWLSGELLERTYLDIGRPSHRPSTPTQPTARSSLK